jgi:hypothetical protein
MSLKHLIIIAIALFTSVNISAQTNTAGWYIVEQGAQYAEYDPFEPEKDANGDSGTQLTLYTGEVVFVTEYTNNLYYCFDPSGNTIVVKGAESLKKAPEGAGVGIILNDIQLISGNTISAGMFVWITGQDIGKQTIRIQLDDNKAYDVPQSQIELLTATIKRGIKNYSFRNTL